MRSLVQPKKITFVGSNGKKFPFLCKPKDDLRRDCRLVDFNNLLNKLFVGDPECRKRDLRIRTYVSKIQAVGFLSRLVCRDGLNRGVIVL